MDSLRGIRHQGGEGLPGVLSGGVALPADVKLRGRSQAMPDDGRDDVAVPSVSDVVEQWCRDAELLVAVAE
jgi:hypothetical protein